MAAQAVLFDLDGVLADSEPIHLAAEQAMLGHYGAELSHAAKQQFVGLSNDEIMRGLIALFGLDARPDELAAVKARYQRGLLPQLRGFAATAELVARLRAGGVPIAVASGSTRENIDASLGAIGLLDAFAVRVSAEEVAEGKPAPDIFLEAARRLGVEPAACVVVEDAVPGIRAARAAGMGAVAIPTITDPLDDAFGLADLVFPGGMASVDVDAILRFVSTFQPRQPA